MVDVAAITDLTYDGNDLQQIPIGTFLQLTKGISEIPSVRGEDDTIASRAGRSPYDRIADLRALELRGYVLGIGTTGGDQRTSYRTLLIALNALLAAGSLAPLVLACTLEDGSGATINARVSDFDVTERVPGYAAEVKVALESVDPDWVITAP